MFDTDQAWDEPAVMHPVARKTRAQLVVELVRLQAEITELEAKIIVLAETVARVEALRDEWSSMTDRLGKMRLDPPMLTSADSVRMFNARGLKLAETLDGTSKMRRRKGWRSEP